MLEPARGVGLALEARHGVGVARCHRVQDLDRDVGAAARHAEVDLAVAALAEHRLERVLADLRAGRARRGLLRGRDHLLVEDTRTSARICARSVDRSRASGYRAETCRLEITRTARWR